MTDIPGRPGDGEIQPDVVDALISVCPDLSDFGTGDLRRPDGEPLGPDEHILFLSATSADIAAAKRYLAAKSDFHLSRYENISRLADLTEPYNPGSLPLSEILPSMPADERAEVEEILSRIAPGGVTGSPEVPTGRHRDIELARLEAIRERADNFVKSKQTGEQVIDAWSALRAVDLLMQIDHSLCRLHGLPAPQVIITADEASAKLADIEQRSGSASTEPS